MSSATASLAPEAFVDRRSPTPGQQPVRERRQFANSYEELSPEAAELARHIAVIEDSLRKLETSRPEISRTLSQSIRRNAIKADSSAQFFLFRFISDFDDQIRLWQAKRRIDPHYRIEAAELGSLLRRKRQLQRQASSLIAARRLLSLWHAVHIPIGMILFATTFVHIIGAVYYATLLR